MEQVIRSPPNNLYYLNLLFISYLKAFIDGNIIYNPMLANYSKTLLIEMPSKNGS
jgi:hypothetical protein